MTENETGFFWLYCSRFAEIIERACCYKRPCRQSSKPDKMSSLTGNTASGISTNISFSRGTIQDEIFLSGVAFASSS